MKNICISFKKALKEDYDIHGDIIRCLLSYIGFLKQFAYTTATDDTYRKFTKWQIADLIMSTYNEHIDTKVSILETLWRWSRRIGKSQKLTALAVFGALMDFKVVWRATFTDQLQQASEWFNMNPFVSENRITNLNRIGVFASPNINISVLSEAKVASRGADWIFYDEGGMCLKDHKKHEYYEMSRGMIMDSQNARITHASTPALFTVFHDVSQALEREEYSLNTKLQSHHPWHHSTWITKQKIERERALHADCPWYIQQNYGADWVSYGGKMFDNIILQGDPLGPRNKDGTLQFYNGFLEKMHRENRPNNWGVDFNGKNTQHFRIGIAYNDYYVYVLEETRFLNLLELDELEGSVEVEDGQFNIQFTDQCKRLGLNVKYQAWNEYEKQARVEQLNKRKCIISKRISPVVYKNMVEGILDPKSRLPKLKKTPDQHGIDGLLHAIHKSTGKIYVPSNLKKYGNPLLGFKGRHNPLGDL